MECSYCHLIDVDCNKNYCDTYNKVRCKKCDGYDVYNKVYRYGCDNCCSLSDTNSFASYPVTCGYCGYVYDSANIHTCIK